MTRRRKITARKCSTPGCGEPHVAKGLCRRGYYRKWKRERALANPAPPRADVRVEQPRPVSPPAPPVTFPRPAAALAADHAAAVARARAGGWHTPALALRAAVALLTPPR